MIKNIDNNNRRYLNTFGDKKNLGGANIVSVININSSFSIRSFRLLQTTLFLILILNFNVVSKERNQLFLNEAVSTVIRSSKELDILKKKIKIKQSDHQIAVAELLPKVDAEFGLDSKDYKAEGRDPLATINVLGDDLTVFPTAPSKYSSQFNVSLSQTLFAGGRILNQIKVADLNLKKAEIDYSIALASKQNEVSKLYWNTLSASNDFESANKLIQLTQKKRDFLRRKSDKGFLSRKNLREANIKLVSRKQDSKLRSEILTQSMNQLSRALGVSKNTLLLGTLPNKKESREEFFKYLKRNAKTKRSLRIKQSKIDIQIQSHAHTISFSPFMPQVMLKAGVDYFDSNNQFRKAFDDLKYGNSYILIAVKYNLFSGFKNLAELNKTDLQKNIAKVSLKEDADMETLTTETYIQTCQKAFREFNQAKQNYDSMVILLKEAKLQFNQNQLSNADIIDTQIQLAETKLMFKKTAIQVEIALHELAFHIGEGDEYLRRYKSNEK